MKIEDRIRLVITEKINSLVNEISELTNFTYNTEDIYYKVSWYDNMYPTRPSGEEEFKTFDEAILWLSEQEHPMSYTGCSIYMGLYIEVLGKEIEIESFDDNVEELATSKRNENKK